MYMMTLIRHCSRPTRAEAGQGGMAALRTRFWSISVWQDRFLCSIGVGGVLEFNHIAA